MGLIGFGKTVGKGTQAPKIKEKFNCCHLVCQLGI